jgi:amino acid transporter
VRRGLNWNRLHGLHASVRTVRWDQLVNLLIYNSAGYDASAAIISHVIDPRTTVPIAMVLVAVSIALLYSSALLFPYLALSDDASAWQSGHFVVAARELGGDTLALWIMIACMLTNLQIYVSALMTASYTVHSMSAAGIFPRALNTAVAGTPPQLAIGACALVSLVFGAAPLLVNLSIESVLYVCIMLAELACFLKDDGDRSSTFRISPAWRRAACVGPVVLSMWVLVVQNRYVTMATLACVTLLALFSIRPEAAVERRCGSPARAIKGRPATYVMLTL